jgi:DNA polymerase III epsilon subunit-like protein
MKTYNSLVHLNGNLMAAIDFETTGLEGGYHEIIQIGIVPLNADLRPNTDLRPFYHNLAPKFPERSQAGAGQVHGLNLENLMLHSPSSERVADLLVDWWHSLDLPEGKTLVPLGFNWEFETSHGKAWLGDALFNQLFHGHARDGMRLAISLNDRAAFAGEPVPFARVGLRGLCKYFGVTNENPHDALSDAFTEAEVYRSLLHHGLFE